MWQPCTHACTAREVCFLLQLIVLSDIFAKRVLFRAWDERRILFYFLRFFPPFFYFSHYIFERAVHIADARARLHARSRGIRNAIRPA